MNSAVCRIGGATIYILIQGSHSHFTLEQAGIHFVMRHNIMRHDKNSKPIVSKYIFTTHQTICSTWFIVNMQVAYAPEVYNEVHVNKGCSTEIIENTIWGWSLLLSIIWVMLDVYSVYTHSYLSIYTTNLLGCNCAEQLTLHHSSWVVQLKGLDICQCNLKVATICWTCEHWPEH